MRIPEIVHGLRTCFQKIIIYYHEPSTRDFVIKGIKSLDRKLIHVAIEPENGDFVDWRWATNP